MSMPVCACVTCLSACFLYACEHTSGTTHPIFTNIVRVLPIAVARSFGGGAAIRNALYSCGFTDDVMAKKR